VGVPEWIAFAALCTAVAGTLSLMMSRQTSNRDQILTRIEKNKEELNDELAAIRISAYEEYKILRKEMAEVMGTAYREFGETVFGIRQKVTEVELWIRDELKDTRHTLQGGMDMRHSITDEKIEKVSDRVRQLEIGVSRKSYNIKE
jgi:predicted DNA-binding protein (UPF0251 family)